MRCISCASLSSGLNVIAHGLLCMVFYLCLRLHTSFGAQGQLEHCRFCSQQCDRLQANQALSDELKRMLHIGQPASSAAMPPTPPSIGANVSGACMSQGRLRHLCLCKSFDNPDQEVLTVHCSCQSVEAILPEWQQKPCWQGCRCKAGLMLPFGMD